MMPPNFWSALAPGWFLQWAVELATREHPQAAVAVVSDSAGPLCGFVPREWSGARITLHADDERCGICAIATKERT